MHYESMTLAELARELYLAEDSATHPMHVEARRRLEQIFTELLDLDVDTVDELVEKLDHARNEAEGLREELDEAEIEIRDLQRELSTLSDAT